MTSIETNDILYRILSSDTGLMELISGKVYVMQRPEDSQREDIVVSNIAITHDHPATATSNVNVYARDIKATISGKEQFMADTSRLRVLSNKVIEVLEGAKETGVYFYLTSDAVLQEQSVHQHYINLRFEWNIHTT